MEERTTVHPRTLLLGASGLLLVSTLLPWQRIALANDERNA